MHMVDDGFNDEKVVAVCTSDPFYKDYNSIHELPQHVSDEIKHFFKVYKMLEGKETIILGDLDDADVAKKVIEEAIDRYKEIYK